MAEVLGGPGVLFLTGPEADYRPFGPALWTAIGEKQDPSLPLYDPRNIEGAQARLLVVKRNATVPRKILADLRRLTLPLPEIPALIIDTEGVRHLPAGATVRLVEQLLGLLPRAQDVRFDDVPATDPSAAREVLISLPA